MSNHPTTAQPTPTKFGTFGGVFTPCTLTILGVIMFLRIGQVVGQSGIFYSVLIILAAKSITTLMTLSLSAIAKNTRVKGGGAYYLISRSLSVEFGRAIGSFYAGALAAFDPKYLQDNVSSRFQPGETFFTMFAMFFPALTGIMAGANMSGDLANPSKSIPRGTLLAVIFAAVIYLSQAVLLGCVSPADELIGNNMIVRDVSFWPILITAGVFAATISSALGSMNGM